jgi:cation diffusion facilitator family transporter
MEHGMDQDRRKARVAWLSVFSNATLVAGKIVVGLAIGSVSVISEAIHSGVDLLAAIIALVAVKSAGKPADDRHPFGHGKFENASGTIEALLIFFAAGWIVWEAVKRLLHPAPLDYALWGVLVMAVSAVANIVVSHFLFKIGNESHSVALVADAWHLRTDVYTSAGVMVALAVIWLAAKVAPATNLQWVDPVAAILVAVLILKAAYDLTRQAARDLMDVSLPAEEEEWLRDCITNFSPTVKGFHRLRTRKAGPFRFVEFHLIVDPEMSVHDSHQLTEQLAQAIRDKFPQSSVLVHIEPCDGECAPACVDGCLLPDDEQERKRRAYRREV